MTRTGWDFCPCQDEVMSVSSIAFRKEQRGCDRPLNEASKASDEATMHVI